MKITHMIIYLRYGVPRMAHISRARWRAMETHVRREYCP